MKKFMRATYTNCSPHNNPRGGLFTLILFFIFGGFAF